MITKKEVFYAHCDGCGQILYAGMPGWTGYFESLKDVKTQMQLEGWQVQEDGRVLCNHCWTGKKEG